MSATAPDGREVDASEEHMRVMEAGHRLTGAYIAKHFADEEPTAGCPVCLGARPGVPPHETSEVVFCAACGRMEER